MMNNFLRQTVSETTLGPFQRPKAKHTGKTLKSSKNKRPELHVLEPLNLSSDEFIEQNNNENPYIDNNKKRIKDYAELQAAPITRFSMLFFFLVVFVALFLGWSVSEEELLAAEKGLGYYLGIAGSVMMLLLVLYPIRKKVSFMKHFGAIKYWFHIHIIFGTLGPAFILFHANFGVGSLNSALALAFTLLVACSGFFHLFIYTKVHYSLYGKKMSLKELQEKMDVNRSSLQHIFHYAPKLKQRLLSFEDAVLKDPHSILQSVTRILNIGFKARWNYFILLVGLRRGLKITAKRAGWPASELRWQRKTNRQFITEYMDTILKIVELNFYERLFAQWYLFHGPLFYMLILVATLHVIAVHMY